MTAPEAPGAYWFRTSRDDNSDPRWFFVLWLGHPSFQRNDQHPGYAQGYEVVPESLLADKLLWAPGGIVNIDLSRNLVWSKLPMLPYAGLLP